MVYYRRSLVPGGTFFFTVTLVDRRSSALTDHVVQLRHAFRITRAERPFEVDAIVKHGLVTRVTDWPYSSFHRYVRRGWLPDDWAGTVEDSSMGFGERNR